jgi:hypothetical protein
MEKKNKFLSEHLWLAMVSTLLIQSGGITI